MNETAFAQYSYLIVDDDRFTCELIAGLLLRKDATQIQIANDAQSASRYLMNKETYPDIIICDLNMPETDGVEFVRYLAEELFRGGIILISGSDKAMLNAVRKLGQANELNMLGVLSKPFAPDDLLRLISQYGGKRQFPDKAAEG